ncbi:hypothetical protein HU200_065928 [Digitaria exilis]|uniref:Calmodulin-binding domain-containing protein n=1 Tax=Digitaria exilis TaxID=1010633 RepID=A0A835A346_9POAL|nr:hypothetical protein HU200_065928 [Digitaria exilis]
MELQMAPQVTKSMGLSTPPHHHGSGVSPVPGYLRPPAGHHDDEFEDKEMMTTTKKKPHSKPRKQQPAESQSRVMVKVRSVFRRHVGDSSRADKAAAVTYAGEAKGGGGTVDVEWKDIVAYDTATAPLPDVPHGSSPHPDKISTTIAGLAGSGDAKKKKEDVKKEKKPHDQATITDGVETEATQDESLEKKTNTDGTTESIKLPNITTQTSLQSVRKPPFQPVGGVVWILGKKKKKKPTSLLVGKMVTMDQEVLHGYEILSPSIMQSHTTLLHDLEGEMAHSAERGKQPCSLDEEEYAAVVAAETSRPIPAHRRVKSMSINSRSVWYPITRQASKNSAVTFKPRSRSTRALITPPEEEEKPVVAEEAERAKPPCSLDEEEYAAVVVAETMRPIPAHRRAKSMSISSRSVWYPIARQPSKNSVVTFKLQSRSTKMPIAPSEEEEKSTTARMRSRRVEDASSGNTCDRGTHLRIRSFRRRGLGDGGFVVPAVTLRHQKTLEKKKSQMLYNNVIEETASKLVKTRKSKVKALVGAFESVINKIAK